jgi:hypothetical protein
MAADPTDRIYERGDGTLVYPLELWYKNEKERTGKEPVRLTEEQRRAYREEVERLRAKARGRARLGLRSSF